VVTVGGQPGERTQLCDGSRGSFCWAGRLQLLHRLRQQIVSLGLAPGAPARGVDQLRGVCRVGFGQRLVAVVERGQFASGRVFL